MTLIRDFAQNIKSDGDLVITGDLQVTGTTTTLETATLNVEDKNITLNYSTGDSSATASGAGITIQDAINSSTDATILWNTTSNQFDFSNKINVAGDAQVFNFYGQDMHVLNAAGTGWHEWGTRANDKIDLDVGTISSGPITSSGVINITSADASFIVANFYSNETQANLNIGRGASERLNFYVTDSQAYIRYYQDEATTIDHSVNFQIISSSSGPNLFKFNSYIESGTGFTVNGSRILAGQYSSGHIATWGGQRSSGGPVMGYGVWPATTGAGLDFVSSSDITLQRSAFILNGNNFQWWNADSSTTTLDSAVTLDLKMDLGRSGLILNAGTGLVVGSTNVTPLGGTQVYINKDGNTGINLQRWGEGDANDASSYRFRIDQNFKFIGNDGTNDKVTINSSTGNIEFANGSGLDFNAVQSTASGTTPSSAILDDYEEGTWTPEIVGDTASGTASYGAGLRNGRYQKVGRLVHLSFYIKGTFTATPTGLVKITGLPFSSPAEDNYPATSGAIGYPISGFEGQIYAYVQKNDSSIYFGYTPSGGTLAGATFGTHMSNSSFQIHLSLCYNSSA